MNIPEMMAEIRARTGLSKSNLAHKLGVSLASVSRWEAGTGIPSPAQIAQIQKLYDSLAHQKSISAIRELSGVAFSSYGVRNRRTHLPLFDDPLPEITYSDTQTAPVLARISYEGVFSEKGLDAVEELVTSHPNPAVTIDAPPASGMSAGKNTYTYDAHTYHTKVPPQGILELLRHYLPGGGLVFDPFAGSGMTGVAASIGGYDCILNELSPAACFIASRFTAFIDPLLLERGVTSVLDKLRGLRTFLYTTYCRECGKPTEILYTVWSYRVICTFCRHEFQLWDHCRYYGRTVKEHKILSEFPCPACNQTLQKSRLQRTVVEPVAMGYKCCGSKQVEVTHPPTEADLERIRKIELVAPFAEGFYPIKPLPDGVNLRQPIRQGIDSTEKFYTTRNLAAMSHLWKVIQQVESAELAAFLAFVFTSLYKRVTRFSEFRFWGGSGNTARLNVPFVFDEANVFRAFSRKAQSIQDHLEATASRYTGRTVVVQNSATSLHYLPSESIDLIFTDPPFGANINYSEMNFLWEAWLGSFTNVSEEAIVNKVRGKGIHEYQQLMTQSLKECYRVLRPNHWMLLVFMNSSREVWKALQQAITDAGFEVRHVDVFDKQHGTFKQFVSENTAGADLVLHCFRPEALIKTSLAISMTGADVRKSILKFLDQIELANYATDYLHVDREQEVDVRRLYSEWLSYSLLNSGEPIDFADFRSIVAEWLPDRGLKN